MSATEQIIEDFANAWKTLDAELIIKHLDSSFVYDSQWVFDSLDYNAYIDYIRVKFETIKKTSNGPSVMIVPDRYSECGKMIVLKQSFHDAPCFYRIKIADGKVVKGDLCVF
ncbi:MAG: hypothetical protein J6T86_00380 [Bacteroidales bacterium]|nr:hypothetical protein [Bacteroidales bacterium]